MGLGPGLSLLDILLGLVIAFAGAWLYHVSIMFSGFVTGVIFIFPIFAQSNFLIAIIASLIGGVFSGLFILVSFFRFLSVGGSFLNHIYVTGTNATVLPVGLRVIIVLAILTLVTFYSVKSVL